MSSNGGIGGGGRGDGIGTTGGLGGQVNGFWHLGQVTTRPAACAGTLSGK